MKTSLSKLATSLLHLKGKPFSFKGYKPFEAVYNTSAPNSLLMAGRQVGKSVSLAGRTVIESVAHPYFNTLYIAPLSAQASRFSSTYLDPYLSQGLIKKYFRDTESKKNVFEKSLSNGSRIYLGYGDNELEVDRVRGVSADSLMVDEVQDVDSSAIPVLAETLAASEYAFKRFSGTSKTLNNTLEYYWRLSNQMEFGIKCPSCGKWSLPNTIDSCLQMTRSEKGPMCVSCDTLLDVESGEWIVGRPSIKDFSGFHLPQIVFGSRTGSKWASIYEKVHNGTYSPAKIANEVFGLAFDFASRPISVSDALKCCNNDRKDFEAGWVVDTRSISCVIVAVDWSVSGGVNSFTVINVLGWDHLGKVYVLYSQRLQGVDILEQVARVKHLYHTYNANAIASDRGVGVLQGQLLMRDLGPERVYMVQYTSGKEALRYDQIGGYYAANRTQAIDKVVYSIKMGRQAIETPCWDLMENFWADAFSLYDEETLAGMRVYRKDPGRPDDWIHSLTFGFVGREVWLQRDGGDIAPVADEPRYYGDGEQGYESFEY